jgi:hypothetical protein
MAAAGGGTSNCRGPKSHFESFSSFQPSSNEAKAATSQFPVKDDAAAVRRRQAEERKRLIAQLQHEEDEEKSI